MGSKPLRCRLGLHTWVRSHPADERLRGADRWACTRCRKHRTSGSIPLGLLGG